MKTNLRLLALSVLVLSFFYFWGCSGKYVAKADEEIYGTWTNEKAAMQKTTTFAGGWKNFAQVADQNPSGEGTQEIEARWKDSEGNTWYKTFGTITAGMGAGEKFQTLQEISKSGTEREWVFALVQDFSPKNYPAKIDLNAQYYFSYSRSGS